MNRHAMNFMWNVIDLYAHVCMFTGFNDELIQICGSSKLNKKNSFILFTFDFSLH